LENTFAAQAALGGMLPMCKCCQFAGVAFFGRMRYNRVRCMNDHLNTAKPASLAILAVTCPKDTPFAECPLDYLICHRLVHGDMKGKDE